VLYYHDIVIMIRMHEVKAYHR